MLVFLLYRNSAIDHCSVAELFWYSDQPQLVPFPSSVTNIRLGIVINLVNRIFYETDLTIHIENKRIPNLEIFYTEVTYNLYSIYQFIPYKKKKKNRQILIYAVKFI